MATRIVDDLARPHGTKKICAAVLLALGAVTTAHASTFCLPGNGSSGSYDTFLTGADILVNPYSGIGNATGNIASNANGTPNGTGDANAGAYSSAGWVNQLSPGQVSPGWTTLAAEGSTSVISLPQTISGSGQNNTCQNGGANASNTLATEGYVQSAIASIPQATGASNAVQYDTDSSGNKLNSVTLQGGASGTVTVTNVSPGNLSASSTDAVNGSQLYSTNQNVSAAQTTANNAVTSTNGLASALGGGASVSSNGAVTAPTYSVQGGTYYDVGSALGALNGAVTNNTSNINNLLNGTAGLVQTNGQTITVGASDPSTDVNIAGANGARVLSGVANGVAPTDAANIGQLDAATANTLNQANAYTDQATKYFKANSTGAGSVASGTDTVAIGPSAVASGSSAIAMGNGAQAQGTESISIGTGNVVTGNNSGAIGDPNTVSGSGSYAVGNNNTIANNNTFVVGNNVTTTQDNSVVVGNGSADHAAVAVSGMTLNGTTYGFAGVASTANGVVSVGASGAERQVINVAAGQLSASSTDAVNGSQLYATNKAVNALGGVVGNLGTSTASALGGGATYNSGTGTISAPSYTIQGSTYNNVGAALSGLDGSVTNLVQGHSGLVQTNGQTITVGANDTSTLIDVSGVNGDRTITGVAPGTAPNDAATVGQVGQGVQAANAYTNQQIGIVSRQLNALGAAAMAATSLIPNARAEGVFQVSAAAGTYGGQTALALGANWWPSDRLLVNAHVTRSTGSGGSVGASVGATFGF
ncbi:hypothetical protein FAZ95_38975 [Trinickia violacea]|uniref:Hemagglutinin n=1 Tax=Trinickia violacea TaxID=2571746 RepID=A0A4P8J3K4_9BURK|nr:YadA-like family protein [Trinickia violacea]QCP55115.1 hypothetical protein FAZ95_38975 [Trinickia violacea]